MLLVVGVVVLFVGLVIVGVVISLQRRANDTYEAAVERQRARRRAWSIHDDDAA